MDRRTFLFRLLIGGTAAMSPGWRPAEASSTFPGILLIDGVTPGTSPSLLFSYLDPIISQNIPVGIAVKVDGEDASALDGGAELTRLLARLVADYPGLVDLALDLPNLAARHPYLQMRAASEARNQFGEFLTAALGRDTPAAVPQTIVTGLQQGEVPVIEGLRTAGILNTILLPDSGTAPEIWRNSDGTQQINGGWRLPPSPTGDDLSAVFAEAAVHDGPVVFAAAFPGDPSTGDGDLFARGSVIGDAFRKNLVASRNYLILPSELRVRSGEAFARNLVVCIRSDNTGATPGSLQARFTAAGIPFTEIGNSPAGTRQQTADTATETATGCVVVAGTDGSSWQEARRLAFGSVSKGTGIFTGGMTACAAAEHLQNNSDPDGRQSGFDVLVDVSTGDGGFAGFDAHGALRINASLVLGGPYPGLSAQTLRQRIQAATAASADALLVIDAGGFGEANDASALAEALRALGASDEFDLLDVPQFMSAISVTSEPARLLRTARRWPARPDANGVGVAVRDMLMEDAARAWSYIERMTDPNTGLVPATAWMEGDTLQAYQFSTMWDTGSLILGILSAHSIGLLTDAQFDERIRAVLGGLATGVFDGLRLPKGLASTDGKARGGDDYNASDTSRLLTALHLLKTYTKSDLGIAAILKSWDLGKTIRDGVPLTVGGGRLVSAYRSNYAGYIARGFGLWGYPVRSPYSEPPPGSSFDRGVHILHDVAEFGPVGTEPHLLEAVELGASDLARAASEALFTAQVEEYLSTGKLVCVSEGPINRAPWFVYQGFQIGPDGGRWTVETLDSSPRFRTKGFLRAIDMLNSKAAFLWNAYRPGEYSDLLIEQVREKAKTESLGFSPGVFSVTGTPDQAYSDINTNGVILQAIAYRLHRGTPCVDWNSKT
ncbi:DUF3131 domain-containing protein [Silicimonas sp. MF1-12-2]|uniref:DUF3131 domain-containing protein n=1 Tax=Silicimonas sp. MF1-12-2 TaxID=3384793 RepID=UPI0039B4CE96